MSKILLFTGLLAAAVLLHLRHPGEEVCGSCLTAPSTDGTECAQSTAR